jgi:hypothetical protein
MRAHPHSACAATGLSRGYRVPRPFQMNEKAPAFGRLSNPRRIGRQAPVKRCLARCCSATLSLRGTYVARLAPRTSYRNRALLRALAQIKPCAYDETFSRSKAPHPYGNIWRSVRTSASLTSVSFLSLRMRPGFLVPSR